MTTRMTPEDLKSIAQQLDLHIKRGKVEAKRFSWEFWGEKTDRPCMRVFVDDEAIFLVHEQCIWRYVEGGEKVVAGPFRGRGWREMITGALYSEMTKSSVGTMGDVLEPDMVIEDQDTGQRYRIVQKVVPPPPPPQFRVEAIKRNGTPDRRYRSQFVMDLKQRHEIVPGKGGD